MTREGIQDMLSCDVWGAFVGDAEFVGFAASVITDSCHLSRLAVLPPHRRNGIGSQLLESCIAECRKRGIGKMYLAVQADNTPAVQLYARHGFTTFGRRHQFLVPLHHVRNRRTQPYLTALPVSTMPRSVQTQIPAEWAYVVGLDNPPLQRVLVFVDEEGALHGMARLAPDMPGCMPFVLHDPTRTLASAVAAISELVDPKHPGLFLTVDDDMRQLCKQLGYAFGYELNRMELTIG
jgi:hypothetical protein